MTKELAIRILTGDVLGTSEQTHEAVKIAVDALSETSAQPERKKGSWIGAEGLAGIGIFVCDQCAGFALMETDFCPNCGAKMQVTAGRQKK